MNYLFVIFLLGLLILVHEAGHFLAARGVGIPVSRFSIGFGPRLWGFRRGETEYRLSWIPLGGYVMPAVEDEHQYLTIPLGRRIIFSLGGPVANLLLPVVLFAVLNTVSSGFSLWGALVAPWTQTFDAARQLLALIPLLFAHPDQLSGLVGIVAGGGQFVAAGWVRAVEFSILLSVNLAVFNLLPIPALDGGKIVLHLLEQVHPAAKRLFVPCSMIGIIFVLGLILYATALDVGRLIF